LIKKPEIGFYIRFFQCKIGEKKMKDCVECGKTLGIFEGYQHPTMGKKHHLCGPCFDQISVSVARWGEFVRTNSFNMNDSKSNYQLNWKEMIPNFNSTRNIIENVSAETDILMRQK